MKGFLIAAATIAAMVMLVPLIVWGGTGDWRHALHALKEYLRVMGAIVAVGLILTIGALLAGM